MTILLLNQFFWPDSAATSQLLTELAHGLTERGHDVHAICAQPGYAPEDGADPPRVRIHRTRTSKFMRGTAGRIASYGLFFLGAAWKGLTVPRPDMVITLTTPPLISLIGTLLKAFRGSKHFIWEMDVYPDVAVDLGYIKAGSMADRTIGFLSDWSRRCSDGVLALGTCMRDRLLRRGLDNSKVYVAENWSDSKVILPVAFPPEHEPLTVLYSGNLGLAHDVETIAEAMQALKTDARFRFVFAGSGAQRAALQAWCEQRSIDSVEFRPYSSKANLSESLGAGHIGLITQKEASLGSVVPSKLYGLLAAGRPILFIGPKESTVAQVIQRYSCGWRVASGDVTSLTRLLEHLAQNVSEVQQTGQRARQAFLQNYDRPFGVARICAIVGASTDEEIFQSLEGLAANTRSFSLEKK